MFRIFLAFSLFSLSGSTTFAQQELLQKIVAGYENSQPLSEQVLVHTDKSFYVCGEILWFKVYVLNMQTHQLQDISHTAYIELISNEGKPVTQAKVHVDGGTGDGSFDLPSTMESGTYLLRAYTNWMKNEPLSFFERPITVINTRKALDTSRLAGMISRSTLELGNAPGKYDVVVSDSGQPSVVVKLNGANDENLFLVTRQGNKVTSSSRSAVQNNEAFFKLNTSAMTGGVTEIDIVNSQLQQVFQTYYYKKEKLSETIHISTDKRTYNTRNKVALQIEGAANNSYHLSVSVYLVNDINRPGKDNNLLSIWQTDTDANGFLNLASYSVKPINTLAMSNLEYLPEMNGTLLTVIARKSGTSAPAANVPVYVSVEGKLANVQVGRTNNEGLAYFNFRDLYGASQLVLQTDPEYQDGTDLSISKSYFPVNTQPRFTQGEIINSEMESSLEALHNNAIIDDYYAGSKLDSFAVTNRDSISFYGKPYKTYMLDNYKRFVTMEEVLREYVQEVNVRIRNKDYHFQTFNRQFYDLGKYMSLDYMMTDGSPLVLLDGVPVADNNKIIKYNPLLVRKLEVVADKFHIGPKVWNGLVSFVTYKGSMEDFQLDPKDIVVDFDGWQRPRYFYTPDYSHLEIKNSRVPDFRSLLYWSPEIKMQSPSKLNFYTGDLTGKFVVVVQGISDTGAPVYETTTFDVVR